MAKLLIRGATVIDGTGGPPLPDHAVLVEDERIEAVGPSSSLASDGAEVFDATGLTLLPGLINMHMHLSSTGAQAMQAESDEDTLLQVTRNARLALTTGVTTVRELGCRQCIS